MFEITQEVVDRFRAGDARCKYKVGARVKKVSGEDGDHHRLGTSGTITGSTYVPGHGGAYLVQFDGEENETFIVEGKLEGI